MISKMLLVFVTRHKVAISETGVRMVFLGGHPVKYLSSSIVCVQCEFLGIFCLSGIYCRGPSW